MHNKQSIITLHLNPFHDHYTTIMTKFALLLLLVMQQVDRMNSFVVVVGRHGLPLSSSTSTALSSTWSDSSSSSSSSSSWTEDDDWNRLSHGENEPIRPQAGQDLATMAAQAMEEFTTTVQDDYYSYRTEDHEEVLSEEDQQVHDMIETISGPFIFDANSVPMYDIASEEEDVAIDASLKSTATRRKNNNKNNNGGGVKKITFEDELGHEIAMLVRCNESPDELLIQQGRALPPLTDEERNDISQLVDNIKNTNLGVPEKSTLQLTTFFRHAIDVMFEQHAISIEQTTSATTSADNNNNNNNNNIDVLKASGVASWMSQSLGTHVSAHDKRVLSIVTKFSQYGTGYLTRDQFHQVYMAAMTTAVQHPNSKMGTPTTTRFTKQKEQLPTVQTIWRDIRNHNILSPVEVQRELDLLEMRQTTATTPPSLSGASLLSSSSIMMDECEILEEGQTYATTTFQTSWADVKRKEQSSHELVQLAMDTKTPLYIKDGDFIFIDEESCIGCMQCVTTAPSNFLMLDHGRARTFLQSPSSQSGKNNDDVKAAVETCPVSCMHRVSFDELTALETAREKGDGRSDHRHCGSSKGHTPLHVSRASTDNNKKDSWYHYLKQKCYLSKDCPQQGCYDCPNFSNPGENPYWKAKHQKAEHVRAMTFIEAGVAGIHRKTVDL